MREINMQSLEIKIFESEDLVPTVELRGEVDLHTCSELRSTLHRLMEAGSHLIIIDMSEVPYLDSAALGVLVDSQRRAKEHGGEIYLAAVTPFVLRAFEITRLIRIFHVFATVSDATAAASMRESK
jgi:anti-sigma B factor antagonist